MSDQSSGAIPAEWRQAADETANETAKALSVARAIERRQYPDGDTPPGLVPALVLSVAVIRADAIIQREGLPC